MTGEFWLLGLLNEEFEWDKANWSVNEPNIQPQPQTDKESIKKALNKMNKGTSSWTSGIRNVASIW